ncbi:MAG: hypothetical protein JST21_06195 [Bacteroidetes bacterium]|nr:hypothetical protein [Bacteroidota bacterium]
MKKFLLSAFVLMGVAAICVANLTNDANAAPLDNQSHFIKDTVPADTTKPDTTTGGTILLMKR